MFYESDVISDGIILTSLAFIRFIQFYATNLRTGNLSDGGVSQIVLKRDLFLLVLKNI